MNKRRIRNVIVLLVSLGLSAGYALAERHDGGRGDRDHNVRREASRRHEVREHRENRFRETRRHDWERDRHMRGERERIEHERRARFERERRERWEREHRADRRPPGWDKGKKVGWGGHSVPPGQASKGTPWQRGSVTNPPAKPSPAQTAQATPQTKRSIWPSKPVQTAKATPQTNRSIWPSKQQQDKH